jgi:uncharacterized protein YlzI (FlbEa/FlbD family)
MRILMGSIIAGVFLFVISMGDCVRAHTYHQFHSLKELENHITGHVKQLELLLNQKSPNKIQVTEQREEILEHVQEYKELVISMALETGSKNLVIVLNHNSELLKQTALNHDHDGSLVILRRVEGLLINPLH